MRELCALKAHFKNADKSTFLYLFDSHMQQPRIQPQTAPQTHTESKKRTLPPAEDSDFEQPFPPKKLAKNFENSIMLSENTNSCSKSLSALKLPNSTAAYNSTENRQEFDFRKELKRSNLIHTPDEGVARFKALLPPHLAVKLSSPYQSILRVAAEADKILSTKQAFGYMWSFQRIKDQIKESTEKEMGLQTFMQINFVADNYYKLYVDPLNNIVLGLPLSFQSLPMRKYTLRKKMYEYAQSRVRFPEPVQSVVQPIPQKNLELSKTVMFFPSLLQKCTKETTSLLSRSFINSLEQEVKQRQRCLSELNSLEEDQLQPDQSLSSMVLEIDRLFKKYKVKNMYKVSLAQWLQKKYSARTVTTSLKSIQNMGVYLHPKQLNSCTVYQLKESELDKILSRLA